ncbi:hypothetical protein PR048_004982 [Dryococelus australis]|uniref:Gag protein n=1 Tax=Dryococelus australis TaxID=614101 RepID=A0ABQ9I7E3_9NEOP|nr:hypothetical protein PR048_004982 [Dryococelus australis]
MEKAAHIEKIKTETKIAKVSEQMFVVEEKIDRVAASIRDLQIVARYDVLPLNSPPTSTTLGNSNSHTLIHLPISVIMHHPSKLWAEQIHKFEGRIGENPVNCLLKFQKYASLFDLSDGDMLRCDTAACFVPGKGKHLKAYLSEMYERSHHLEPPVNDEEFIGMILRQLPFKYQSHWTGRHENSLATFREDLLAFDSIQQQQNYRDNERPPNTELTTVLSHKISEVHHEITVVILGPNEEDQGHPDMRDDIPADEPESPHNNDAEPHASGKRATNNTTHKNLGKLTICRKGKIRAKRLRASG